MNKIYFLLVSILSCINMSAQSDTIFFQIDTARKTYSLQEVNVEGYELNTPLLKTPAAIGIIGSKELNRYSNSSLLPAVNTIPGVRMEERSPNSFRFGIRGSSAQAPFGVRNIKVYYNDIPFTDAGGNTYLNQLGFYNIQGLEVIKGPASSLYGAGTGGVVLINSFPETMDNSGRIHYTAGSYGLQHMAGEFFVNDQNGKHAVRYQHIQSDGYREQSASRKDVFSYDAALRTWKNNELSAHILYSDLYYETPGGLTFTQYNIEPESARPGTATIPGAVQNKAAIYQHSFLAGITSILLISPKWQNSTTLFASYNQLVNPNIRNYSHSSQPNVGGRTTFKYSMSIGQSNLQWVIGAEALQQFVTEKTYKNKLGNPDTLTNDLGINNLLVFGFTQLSWQYKNWLIMGGVSVNSLQVGIESFNPTYTRQNKQFNNQLAPRLAILRKFSNNTSLYVSAEKGYTPPSISELAPTGSNVNLGLQAAQGWNLGAGCRGYALNDRFYFDISMFLFSQSQAIVQRRDSAGGDYYINAGRTEQNGADILLRYAIIRNSTGILKDVNLAISFTGYRFFYKDFTVLTTDYSAKRLPGIPGHTVNTALDIASRYGIYLNLNYYYCEPIFLNDANTDKAPDYTLLDARMGYRSTFKRVLLDVFAGGNNLLNKRYSLGNDINAAAGRYYNAAPGINFFAGLSFGYTYKKPEPKSFNNIIEVKD